MIKAVSAFIGLFVTTLLTRTSAEAWGKQGHAIICETAARLIALKNQPQLLREHSFDLSYYCNVPDLIWKRPATYKLEWFNHFMDLEIFERAFQKRKVTDAGPRPFELDRLSFERAYPDIPESAGRAFWRVVELNKRLNEAASELKNLSPAVQLASKNAGPGLQNTQAKSQAHARKETQLEWLVTAGAIGHYVGDLSQPLHVSENFDGQLSEQKGVHRFYEDIVVDELVYAAPAHGSGSKSGLKQQVFARAQTKWRDFHETNRKKKIEQLVEELASDSQRDLKHVLEIDRKFGRKNLPAAAQAYSKDIAERLIRGSLTLAEMYSRSLEFTYEDEGFFDFAGEPPYIFAPGAGEQRPKDLAKPELTEVISPSKISPEK